MTHEIEVIKGDGIGPEVIEAALPLLNDVADANEFDIQPQMYEWESKRYYESERMMPEDGLTRLKSHDAILLGAVGHPDIPDNVTLHELLLLIRKNSTNKSVSGLLSYLMVLKVP